MYVICLEFIKSLTYEKQVKTKNALTFQKFSEMLNFY